MSVGNDGPIHIDIDVALRDSNTVTTALTRSARLRRAEINSMSDSTGESLRRVGLGTTVGE